MNDVAPDPTASTAPPPPPPWPPQPPASSPTTARPPRAWRDRLPEVVAALGAGLVVLALAGFVSSTWEVLDAYGQAVALAAAGAALTVAGLWADGSGRRTFAALVPTLWATATAVVVAALDTALGAALPAAGRVAIALAGAGGAVHAALLWRRRPDAFLTQLAIVAAALFAAGPVGTALSDTWADADGVELLRPLVGLLDPTAATDAFALVAGLHLAIGVAWLVAARDLATRPAHLARVGGTVVVGYAALELNVLANPMGAALALLVVLGYLVAGLLTDDLFLVVAGTVGALATGVKVIWSLFSGEVAVTLTVFSAGLAMLGWAYRAARRRDPEEPVTPTT